MATTPILTSEEFLDIVLRFRAQLTPDELGMPFEELHNEFDPNAMVDDLVAATTRSTVIRRHADELFICGLVADAHNVLATITRSTR